MRTGPPGPGGAAADAADSLNGEVCRVRDEWLGGGSLLATTDFVTVETLTTIRFRLGLSAAEEWWDQVDGSSRLRTEAVDPSRAELARSIFFRYRDQDFSFTDCTSFAVMRQLRIVEVLTRRSLHPDGIHRPAPP